MRGLRSVELQIGCNGVVEGFPRSRFSAVETAGTDFPLVGALAGHAGRTGQRWRARIKQ